MRPAIFRMSWSIRISFYVIKTYRKIIFQIWLLLTLVPCSTAPAYTRISDYLDACLFLLNYVIITIIVFFSLQETALILAYEENYMKVTEHEFLIDQLLKANKPFTTSDFLNAVIHSHSM